PLVSTPLKLITVIEAATDWDRLAVTVALATVDAAKARQISEVPICVLARLTNVQVRPPPLTLVTVIPADCASVATNASRSSFAEVVENAWLVMVLLVPEESPLATASIVMAPQEGTHASRTSRLVRTRDFIFWCTLYIECCFAKGTCRQLGE